MEITLDGIKYKDRASADAKLIKYSIPVEGQTFEFILQGDIDEQNYPLSSRNGSGAYNVPIELPKVYLNFIPSKILITDAAYAKYSDPSFQYFVDEPAVLPDPFTLVEGQIFRCVSDDSKPMAKEAYTYYIIKDGKKKKIPNYKTLEVMLAERNETLIAVRVVQEQQCQQIELSPDEIPDKSSAWQDSYSDKTTNEVLEEINKSVKAGAEIAAGAKAAADSQVAAVKAAEEKAKAQADQAKTEAAAAKAASEAAIAQANAAQAQAEAAKAEADAKAAALNKQ